MVASGALNADIVRIGRQLHDAFPSPSHNPLKAADDRGLDLVARDRDLRAALFRFVDVAPACRSLDDLATHLAGFLGELDHPPASAGAARRLAETRAGRLALGA